MTKIVLSTAVNAVFPIILLILLGYVLRRRDFLNENFVKTGNSLVFNICLPVMLFINVYNIEGLGSIRWDLVLYCIAVIGVLFVLGLFTALAATAVPSRRGVILQCTFRSNFAIIGLPLAAALGGSEAEATAAVISAFSIPLFNILAVISLSVFVDGSSDEHRDVKRILIGIAKNPLIIGVMAGLFCLLVRAVEVRQFGKPVFSLKTNVKFLYSVLNNLKSVTSPLALIVLGAQFEFSAVKGLLKEIAVGTVFRIVIAPLTGIGLAVVLNHYVHALGWGVNEYPALVSLFGSPVAVSSAVMARSMKNDEQLATQLVVWTSIGSMVTIFLLVCFLMTLGLLAV